jgi:hypothetical protein
MCYEDIKIGRNTTSSQYNLTLSTNSQQAVPADPFRTALLISNPTSGNAYLSLFPVAVAGFGWRLASGIAPLLLTLAEHGTMVRAEWQIVADAGTPTISIFCTSYPFGSDQPVAPK